MLDSRDARLRRRPRLEAEARAEARADAELELKRRRIEALEHMQAHMAHMVRVSSELVNVVRSFVPQPAVERDLRPVHRGVNASFVPPRSAPAPDEYSVLLRPPYMASTPVRPVPDVADDSRGVFRRALDDCWGTQLE